VTANVKTVCAAAVIIPPDEAWRPIQALRARYDRHFARWMPHITLAFPFRPKEEFESLAPQFEEACAGVAPFEIELAEFRFFDHGRDSFTLWLAANPVEPVIALQAAVMRVTPDCDDVARFAGGFTPHLSVGQAHGEPIMQKLRESLQSRWKPVRFQISEFCLIWRGETRPDDTFRVGCKVRLGNKG
jgi:2'-5' RNA ligase